MSKDLHKKSAYQASREETAPQQRLRRNISDLFLAGDISAKRARTLFEDAGAADVEDLAKLADSGNVHRDLLRKLGKKSKWPPVFKAKIPIWDPESQARQVQPLAFFLPHELLWALVKWNISAASRQKLLDWRTRLRDDLRDKVQLEAGKLDLLDGDLVPLGLWVDGVPTKFDRSESLECFSLSLPHLECSSENKHIRLPLTVLNKRFFLRTGETIHGIMKVLAWSLHACLQNCFPAVDPEGNPLDLHWRRGKAGSDLGAAGMLIEIRGDWLCYKQTFALPSWQETNARCCYKCHCTLQHMRSVGKDAPWRAMPSTNEDLLMFVLEKRGTDFVCPLFSLPGVDQSTFVVDWLHTADLGVAADFAGNVMWLLTDRHFPGNSFDERLSAMWSDLRAWYKANRCENQFNAITRTMLRQKASKSPKLKGKAGEIRYLVPWLKDVTERLFAHVSPHSEEACVKQAAVQLDLCYKQLSPDVFSAPRLQEACRKFLLLYTALEEVTPDSECRWKFKPKFHMFQHCCEETQSSPSLFWTYTDETWGGKISQMGKRRGGKHAALCCSENVLNKFRAQNKVPEL